MRRRLRVLSAGVGLSWRTDRRLTLLVSLIVLVSSVTGPAVAVALRGLIDSVVGRDQTGVTWWGLAVATALGLSWFLYIANSALSATLAERTSRELTCWLMRSSSTIPGLEHHERPEYLDRMQLLQNDTQTLVNALPSTIQILGLAVEVATTLGLLAALHPALILLPVFALPSLAAGALAQRRNNVTAQANAEPQRLVGHLFSLTLDARLSKELRIFAAGSEVLARWRATWDRIEHRRLRTLAYATILSSLGSLGFVVGQVAAVALVAFRAADGQASIGDVGLVITLAARVNGQVSRAVGSTTAHQALGQAMERYVWLQDYERDARSGLGDTAPPSRLVHGIELKDVRFRYPGTDIDVLTDINLRVPAGSTVAIVGENGAGKSTLVKLLCRFYDPTAGVVTVDGTDLSHIDIEAWRRAISGAFQDVLRIELLAGESVGIGDQPRADDPKAVDAAITRAGAADVVAAMPSGLRTQLGRDWTDGVDLSGGQWQKIGLARAMMRGEPLLLVLDEPTSALDPHSEHVLFERYAAAALQAGHDNGAITILVSHRFSTVRMADLIVVVNDGVLQETGTHADLMAAKGLYAELFSIQAAAYI